MVTIIEYKYEPLRGYLNAIETFLANELNAVHQARAEYLQEQGFSLSEIQKPTLDVELTGMGFETDEYTVFDITNFEQTFPDVLRRSFFITAYSVFEAALDRECRIDKGRLNLTLSLSDLAGKGIVRAKNYLAKVVGLDFPNTPEWERIMTYNKLRNCMVHNDGRIDDCPDSTFLRAYITCNSHHLDISYGDIEIKKGFCEEVIDTFELFWGQLADSAKKFDQHRWQSRTDRK